MPDKLSEILKSLLPNCMLVYQFIEESLRQCLIRHHAIVHKKVDGLLPYNPPLESINNAAMGKLIEYFKTFNDNKELLSLLNKVKARRDDIAHQGYLMTYEEQKEQAFIDKKHIEIEADLKQAKECLASIHSEVSRLECLANKVYGINKT